MVIHDLTWGSRANLLVENIVPRLELGVDCSIKHTKLFEIAIRRLAKDLGWSQHCMCSCALRPSKVTLRMLCLSAPHMSIHDAHAFPLRL